MPFLPPNQQRQSTEGTKTLLVIITIPLMECWIRPNCREMSVELPRERLPVTTNHRQTPTLWQQTEPVFIPLLDSMKSNSSKQNYECVALCKDISLQRGRFCTRSLASCIPRSSEDRSSCPGALSNNNQVEMKLKIGQYVSRWWGVDVVICLEWGADCLHMVQLMPVHPKTTSSLASFKSRLVLPIWYQLTQTVLKKRLLNGCSSSSTSRNLM